MNIVKKLCRRCNVEITEANTRTFVSEKDGRTLTYNKCRPCIREIDKIYWRKPENKERKRQQIYNRRRSRSFGKQLITSLTEAVNEDIKETTRLG